MAAIPTGLPISFTLDFGVLLPGLYLAGALLVGAAVIAAIRRWSRDDRKGAGASDQLAHYRTLYEQGTISEEEFKRLRGVLGVELRREVDLPPHQINPPPPPSEPSQPGPGTNPNADSNHPPVDGIGSA